MKKIIIIAMTAIIALALVSCGGEQEPAKPSSSGTLGDYEVAIKDYKLTKDYDGTDVIVVAFDFTNNGEESAAFDLAMIYQAFQDGVELETAIMFEEDEFFGIKDGDTSSEIQPGTTIKVKCYWELHNTKKPVKVEVEEFITGDGTVLEKTFKLKK